MPLSQDQLRALQKRPQLPIEGGVVGSRVTLLDVQSDGTPVFGFTSEPDEQVRSFTGDPNGVVFAPKGTLGVERDVPALWINNDGVSGWDAIAGASFTNYWHMPSTVLEPDPTNTAGIQQFVVDITGSGRTLFSLFDDGTPATAVARLNSIGIMDFNVDGAFTLDSQDTIHAYSDNLCAIGSNAGNVFIDANQDLTLGGLNVRVFAGQNVFLNLPTSDPGISGALWNNAGTVKVSP